jgi:hypothetical protein
MSNIITLRPSEVSTVTTPKINENRNIELDPIYRKIMGLQREDYAVPAHSLAVRHDPATGYYFDVGDIAGSPDYSWKATGYAIDQLSDRNSKGLRSLGKEMDDRGHHDLRAHFINEVVKRQSEDLRFRMRTMMPNGERLARAVVSSKFKDIDDPIIVPHMLNIVADHAGKWKALGGQITDTHTYLRFITRDPVLFDIGPNKRDWHLGFMYKNSEVGASKTQYQLFTFDGYCNNGQIYGLNELFAISFVHRGTTMRSKYGLVQNERIQQQELLNIQAAIQEATENVMAADFADRIRASVDASQSRTLTGDGKQKVEQIKLLAKSAGLTTTEQELILPHWETNEENVFGVANAITRLAQDVSTYDSRIRLETAGGKLMEMTDRQFKSIMALAS